MKRFTEIIKEESLGNVLHSEKYMLIKTRYISDH